MRSMASGGAFHCAYLHATQQAFLEAQELACAYFGGVFRKLRYDNLAAAVKKILRGSRREEAARFVAFRSHWRFEAEFCTPGEAHEKGGIEGEAGYFRRNHWVPVPEAADIGTKPTRSYVECELIRSLEAVTRDIWRLQQNWNSERNSVERRIRNAHLPRVNILEEFDFTRLPAGRFSRFGPSRSRKKSGSRVEMRMKAWKANCKLSSLFSVP